MDCQGNEEGAKRIALLDPLSRLQLGWSCGGKGKKARSNRRRHREKLQYALPHRLQCLVPFDGVDHVLEIKLDEDVIGWKVKKVGLGSMGCCFCSHIQGQPCLPLSPPSIEECSQPQWGALLHPSCAALSRLLQNKGPHMCRCVPRQHKVGKGRQCC